MRNTSPGFRLPGADEDSTVWKPPAGFQKEVADMAQLWGGRFTKETDALVKRFNDSLPFDRRLYRQDIQGSMAPERSCIPGAAAMTRSRWI